MLPQGVVELIGGHALWRGGH